MASPKELVVVLAAATAVFVVARPFCLEFVSAATYARRRNVWLALTVVAFLTPSFWGYFVVAVPLIAWLASKDENPHALFLFLYYLIPPVAVDIPIVGINKLFEVTQLRLLGFVLLLPLALRMGRQRSSTLPVAGWQRWDIALAALLAMEIVTALPFESPTNAIRRAFLLALDSFLVLYVMSRLPPDRKKMVDTLLMLCLVCLVAAPLAVFEWARAWLMYAQLGENWGVPNYDAWLFRDDRLRAQVFAGHALTLGYVLSMAFCFWLYFCHAGKGKALKASAAVLLWMGLFAAQSRGPWLTAALGGFLVICLAADKGTTALKHLVIVVIGAVIVLLSPVGDDVIRKLPFVGDDTEGNVGYRQRLMEVSWRLIWQSPLFGDPFVLNQMEELRQGQGIIDLVNAYVNVALFHGFVGLAFFLAIFVFALSAAWRAQRSVHGVDQDLYWLGAVVIAALLATIFYMGVGGFVSLQYPIAGIAISYARLVHEAAARPSPVVRPQVVPDRNRWRVVGR